MILMPYLLITVAASALPDLLPPVQNIQMHDGAFVLPADVDVSAPASWSADIGGYLWMIDEVLKPRGRYRVALSKAGAAITVSESPDPSLPQEGYVLETTPKGITIQARGPAGVFNALATLTQIIEQHDKVPVQLPSFSIRDWPAVPLRAAHIDMTCQQYTGAYICSLMRTLAGYKVNAVLMEYSDMFPFRRHKGICRPDALTERDIADICRTAGQCNIEIIPFLQCLGHLEYVLHKPAYERYGAAHRRYMLCPSSEESLILVRELIDEILTLHPGVRRLHIGGDEVDRGRGGECPRCDAYVQEHGFSALYVNHYTRVAEYCRSKGVIPLMWSDMMLQHPESLPDLPRDIAWVVWDYSTIADPTPALAHGASMAKLDQISPAYRRYFGEGVGLADARQRGGLTAFGHAQGFKSLGFEAFTAPAARCSGDNFDLPRFDMRMRNIRTAFRQAAAFNLSGVILTSWSYRGSPHQVCLPEYACVSYGWNTCTPDVDTLLSTFLRQRYGIDEPSLAPALLALTPIIPPSTRAAPQRDDARDAWVVGADQQLEQIKTAVRSDRDHGLATCRSWLDQLTETAALWRACTQSTRNQHELACWDLSIRHLAHRLELLDPAIRLAAVAFADASARDDDITAWIGQLRAFDGPREQLRQAWAGHYRDTMTPMHLKVELYNRFDAEREMIELLLADVARSRAKAREK